VTRQADFLGLDPATLRELAHAIENRAPKIKDPKIAAAELVAMLAQGTSPTIAWYRKHVDYPPAPEPTDPLLEIAADPLRLVPHAVAAIGRTFGTTITFRAGLVLLADHLIEVGVDRDKLREAFALVLAPGIAA
jgi:hypothetical protein